MSVSLSIKFPTHRKTSLSVTVSYIMVFYLKIHHTKFALFVTVITTPRFFQRACLKSLISRFPVIIKLCSVVFLSLFCIQLYFICISGSRFFRVQFQGLIPVSGFRSSHERFNRIHSV